MIHTVGLIIAYDGTPFVGWQRQQDKYSIQGCLETSISRINNTATQVRGASRTDAGVHAEYQIAAFETCRDYEPERWAQAINATTPDEIQIRHAFIAPDNFQPRFASHGKHYRYWLWQGRFLPPFLRNRAALTRPLDIENMQDAAQYLIGEHDFSAFRAIDCQAKSPIRTLARIDIHPAQSPYAYDCGDEQCLIQIDVEGTAFLKQMVRIIVGTLIEFGCGRPAAQMQAIVESKNRVNAGQTAPAAGLTLVKSYSEIDDILGKSN